MDTEFGFSGVSISEESFCSFIHTGFLNYFIIRKPIQIGSLIEFTAIRSGSTEFK